MSSQLNNQETIIAELSEEDLNVVTGGSHYCYPKKDYGKKYEKKCYYPKHKPYHYKGC
jgi:hypothetical protein